MNWLGLCFFGKKQVIEDIQDIRLLFQEEQRKFNDSIEALKNERGELLAKIEKIQAEHQEFLVELEAKHMTELVSQVSNTRYQYEQLLEEKEKNIEEIKTLISEMSEVFRILASTQVENTVLKSEIERFKQNFRELGIEI